MKKTLSFIWEVLQIVIVALAIVVPIRYFLFQPFFVSGQSMDPSFENGDYLIVDEITYRFYEPERGDVIVFNYPKDYSQKYIKRIVGLPGETIEIKDGRVSIFDAKGEKVLNENAYLPSATFTAGYFKISMEKNQYFVMGDNRMASYDSRNWGVLPRQNIIGRVYLRMWPLDEAEKITAPSY